MFSSYAEERLIFRYIYKAVFYELSPEMQKKIWNPKHKTVLS